MDGMRLELHYRHYLIFLGGLSHHKLPSFIQLLGMPEECLKTKTCVFWVKSPNQFSSSNNHGSVKNWKKHNCKMQRGLSPLPWEGLCQQPFLPRSSHLLWPLGSTKAVVSKLFWFYPYPGFAICPFFWRAFNNTFTGLKVMIIHPILWC